MDWCERVRVINLYLPMAKLKKQGEAYLLEIFWFKNFFWTKYVWFLTELTSICNLKCLIMCPLSNSVLVACQKFRPRVVQLKRDVFPTHLSFTWMIKRIVTSSFHNTSTAVFRHMWIIPCEHVSDAAKRKVCTDFSVECFTQHCVKRTTREQIVLEGRNNVVLLFKSSRGPGHPVTWRFKTSLIASVHFREDVAYGAHTFILLKKTPFL